MFYIDILTEIIPENTTLIITRAVLKSTKSVFMYIYKYEHCTKCYLTENSNYSTLH